MGFLDPTALGGSIAVQTARPLEWLFLAGSFALLGGQLALFRAVGHAHPRPAARSGAAEVIDDVQSGAERMNGVPAWAALPVTVGLWALLTAFIGFVWDVGWHADTGRDKELFTVPHVLILVGLGGIVLAAMVAVVTATRERAPTGWHFHGWHVPFAAVPLFVIGFGALLGFPLDDLWHAAYGIDVTMWSPTHLLMIGGASLSPLPMWLILSEGGAPVSRRGRVLWAFMAGVVMVGLSTLQLEFDMGIPQWQAFYQPLLVVTAMGIGLVAARAAIGRGGAIVAALVFVVLRGGMALLIGGVLGRSLPHFPLYLGGAVCVETVFGLLAGRALLTRALASGVLISTVGLLAEAALTHAWFPYPWRLSLLPYAPLFLAAGVLAAVVGAAMGAVLVGHHSQLKAPMVALALVALFGVLLVNVGRRHADPAQVSLAATTVGTPVPVVDRDGVPTLSRRVALTVRLSPANAAAGADWFEAMAWQGGAGDRVSHFPLVATAPGIYRAQGSIPTGGNWKSLVILHRGNVVEAVPVAMPTDPAFHLGTIQPPLVEQGGTARTLAFAPSSRYLMREFKDGVAWPAIVISALFALVVAAWVGSTAIAYRSFARAAGLRGGTAKPLRSRGAARAATASAG
ncbi:MAG: hypothetical protein ABR573_10645 [Candidatus Dormibacteria bacterium]